MKQYKSLETHYLPPNSVKSIEEFKEVIMNELYTHMEVKKKIQEDVNDDVPLPICMYVLYKDFSIRRAVCQPGSAEEKKAMIMALKKEVRVASFHKGVKTCIDPIYGAFVSEVWMAAMKFSPDANEHEKDMEVLEFKEKYANKEVPRETRVLVQFEDAITGEYDCRAFTILDPCILIPSDQDSEEISTMLTEYRKEANQDKSNLMMSLFDYSPEHEMAVMGQIMNVDHFNLTQAVKFIQDLLKE